MPTYIVTGGEDGDASVEIEGKTYAPKKIVTASKKDVQWLLDGGYLKAKGRDK